MYYQLNYIENEEIQLNNELLNPLFDIHSVTNSNEIQKQKSTRFI